MRGLFQPLVDKGDMIVDTWSISPAVVDTAEYSPLGPVVAAAAASAGRSPSVVDRSFAG